MSLAPARLPSSSSAATSARSGRFRKFTKALDQTPDAIPGAPSDGGRIGNVPADRVSISDLARQRSQADGADDRSYGAEGESGGGGLDPRHAAAVALLAKRQIAVNGLGALAAHVGHHPGAALKLLT
ncbi:MAG: hypothetical protein RL199_991 [Pseudomonadota bacterium]|jgi:hypothetical protein